MNTLTEGDIMTRYTGIMNIFRGHMPMRAGEAFGVHNTGYCFLSPAFVDDHKAGIGWGPGIKRPGYGSDFFSWDYERERQS